MASIGAYASLDSDMLESGLALRLSPPVARGQHFGINWSFRPLREPPEILYEVRVSGLRRAFEFLNSASPIRPAGGYLVIYAK